VFAQQNDISPEVLEKERGRLAIIPESLVTNVQKMSPVRVMKNRILRLNNAEQNNTEHEFAAAEGHLGNQKRSIVAKLRHSCVTSLGKAKDIIRDHSRLALVTAMLITYLILPRTTLRKSPKGFAAWFFHFFTRASQKSGFLGFKLTSI